MRSPGEEMRARLMPLFLAEAEKQIVTLRTALDALRAGADTGALPAAAHRSAHSLAGAAATVERADVVTVARAMESVLDRVARGRLAPGPELLAVLVEGAGLLADLVAGRPGVIAPAEMVARLADAVRPPEEPWRG